MEVVLTNSQLARSIDTIWVLLATFLVFLMHFGFASVESGFTRAKNTVNILMKNFMTVSTGALLFYAVGYGIMFGGDKLGLFGIDGFFLSAANPSSPEGMWQFAFFLFQAVFAATAATIVSGAMAERTKFSTYLIYTIFLTGLVYPVVGHWIWGGGWLAELGFIDFAGSTVVHSVGGWSALIGASILGARIGKYNGDGRSNAIPGHNIPVATLGVLILWFGWFGFNAGSTVSGTDPIIAIIAVNTFLAGAAGAVAAMFFVWFQFGKPDISMTLNGALAGLVSVTAPCANISPISAVLIGLTGGILVVIGIELIDKVFKIDDPVGAIAVHGLSGVWGTLAVGLFAQKAYGGVSGLFFGGGLNQFLIQAIGVIAVLTWTIVMMYIFFKLVSATIGLRVSREEEIRGLDIGEHGMEAYAGFEIFLTE